jgi:anti-sigma regulatory factor (Ser/Thr protein kinase)
MSTTAAQRAAVWHWALLYDNEEQYVDGVLRFVRDALAAERPVFVAVPAAHGELLRRHLNGLAHRVRFADMSAVGRNPSCIIPAIRAFIDEHADRPVSFVGEPIWPGRTPAEVSEATRHEALINAEFDGVGAEVLCPYDVAGLAPSVVADAHLTHRETIDHAGHKQHSGSYTEPRTVWQNVGRLPPVLPAAASLIVERNDLPALRQAVRQVAAHSALPPDRIDDFMIAVTELATNSIRHGGGSAGVALWSDDGALFCEVRDRGTVHDALVGRRTPPPEAATGRGLWLVNRLCDLVQLHSDADGTTVRITLN